MGLFHIMRHRTYGTDKNTALRIRIESENKEWLERQANKVGIAVAEYVRRIIVKEKQTA